MEKSTNNNLSLSLLKKPVKLINKNGTNICWWNSFVQLFVSTNNTTIVNGMNKFINEHITLHNNNEFCKSCWYCTMFKSFITIMNNSTDVHSINFGEFLFNIPDPVVDPKADKKLIRHPFEVFVPNQQQDSFEGCNKWFEVIEHILPDAYDLFHIKTTSEIKCSKCNTSHYTDIVVEPVLSVEIDSKNIYSIQDAINSFQKTEFFDANCINYTCLNKFGYKSIRLLNSPHYLIVHWKRFKQIYGAALEKNKKCISLNDKILIN